MAYCVISDVRNVLPSILDTDAVPNALITQYISLSDAWIDTKLSHIYQTPITVTTPISIKNASAHYCAYLIMQNQLAQRGYSQDIFQMAQDKEKQACAFLEQLVNGTFYDTTLNPQSSNASLARLTYYSNISTSTIAQELINSVSSEDFV